MPPFVLTDCTNPKCKHRNRYDLAELRRKSGITDKGGIFRTQEEQEEFRVTCDKCG